MIVVQKQLDETDKQIIELLSEGKIYKQIAYKLKITTRAVEYRIKVMKKHYDCPTVTALVLAVQKEVS